MWKDSVKVNVVSSSPNHIDAIVGDASETQWRFTGVYGHADASRKHDSWSLLCDLHRQSSLPWMCVGDFNEILWSHEKLGLGPRKESLMRDFQDVLDECGIMDLGFVGDKFTWRGKRAAVLERLDSFVADNGWFALNLSTKVQHLQTHSSNHKAIIIKLDGIIPCPNHPFKFEQMWLHDAGCCATVNKAWGSTTQNATMVITAGKIKACGENLQAWSRQSFGNVKKQLEFLGKKLSKAKVAAALGKLDYEVVKCLKAEVNELLDKESQMW
nr:uncharacterized protein LOC112029413 [Quercus suber]